MKFSPFYLIIIVFCLFSCQTNSKLQQDKKTKQTQQLDSLMTYCQDNGMFNGSIAVIQNDTVLFSKSYGLLHNSSKKEINAETVFYIASISKQFTAMSIMILQERGLLSYDDTVIKFLPELKALDETITIRHLLQHTSGISDRTYYQLKKPSNHDVFMALQSLTPEDFGAPNKRFGYSNTGYVLLALIVEKASGITIDNFYKKEIFDLLQMNRTLTSKAQVNQETNKVQPYNILGKEANYESSVIGPGGIYSTINDLIKWNTGINHNALVSKKTMQLAFSNGALDQGEINFKLGKDVFGYGFGWMPFTKNNDSLVRHDGSTEGYRSLIRKNLSNKLDIILLTNHGSALAMDEITRGIDNILKTMNYETPKVPLPNLVINELKTSNIHDVVKTLQTSIDPNEKPDERVLGRLGFTFQNQNMMAEAIELFKLNQQLHPESTNAIYALGEAYLREDKFQLAKETYEKFLDLKPDSKFAIQKLELINSKIK